MALRHESEVAKFDHYAGAYAEAHAASVRLSGEGPAYFAEHKLGCLDRLGVSPEQSVLDYGCGVGTLTRLLVRRYSSVSAYDPSSRSLDVARKEAANATFYTADADIPERAFDAVILSGVLHHVAREDRQGLVCAAASKLKPAGRLCVFEHNPYNPLTRKAVRDCPFDDDAVLLAPRELRRLLAGAGLASVRQDYVLFFPRPLARLRPLEARLRWLPLGAQTLSIGVRGRD